ncbi:hypothetical protein QLX08_005677 [Tetragonisca angustula]|uniref:Secreted protein n=1 Tax=Tetragonisca angustula TaxID=166442 RepID=A0AAW0ZX36_9HYME
MTSRLAMWIGVSMLQLATRLVASALLRRVGGVIDWLRGACVPTSPRPYNGDVDENTVVSRRRHLNSPNKWHLNPSIT